MTTAVDLCAGPGGWDVAARRLGIEVVGIEWDEAACETRRAAGLPTIQGDIRKFGPLDFAFFKGLIASPPCQTFSAAGKGAGRAALDLVRELILKLAAREEVDYSRFDDDRTGLVLEPLRWALEAIDEDIAYEWLAFEQVPSVLPVWEAMAEVLREEGYTVVTGKLSAEEYGVPQTRQRAILMARRDGAVALPTKTHRKYKKGVAQDAGDQNLLPWVSMAQALGWTRPGAVGFPRRADSPEEKAKGVVEIDGVEYRARDLRDVDEPSFVVTEKARSWGRYAVAAGVTGEGRPRYGDEPAPTVTAAATMYFCATNLRPNSTLRSEDEPAPTLAFGHETPQWIYEEGGEVAYRNGNQENTAVRPADEPAPTVHFGARANAVDWVFERPATTVQCDARIGQPGHKCMTEDCHPGRGKTKQFDKGSVRVTPEEASALQSFPPDHPWQGSRTKRFQQIGNAIPPLLAESILSAIIEGGV